MREYCKVMVAGVFLVGSMGSLSANDMKSKMGNIPLGNVGGSTGNVFPEGKSRFVIKNLSLSKDGAYDGDDEVKDPKSREMNFNKTLFLYRYGLGHGFDIRVATTRIEKKMSVTVPKGPKAGESFDMKNDGLGDSLVVLRYQVLSQIKGAPLFLSVGGGFKLPTGSTDKSFTTPMGKKEAKQAQPMQLGSGSYDYIAEIGATKLIPNSRVDAYMMYVLTTEGDYDYEFGDKLKWNVGYSYAINKYFDVQMEVDGLHFDKNSNHGHDVDASGGNFIYITPGIHIIPNKKFDISVGYSQMMYRDNNYDSINNSGGLSEDYRWTLRAGYNF